MSGTGCVPFPAWSHRSGFPLKSQWEKRAREGWACMSFLSQGVHKSSRAATIRSAAHSTDSLSNDLTASWICESRLQITLDQERLAADRFTEAEQARGEAGPGS